VKASLRRTKTPFAEGEKSMTASHSEIVNRVGRKITGITSENSMKNVFYRLRDRGLIEPVPGRVGFGSAWRKTQKATDENTTEDNKQPKPI
jgi:hypothetical protein